MSDPIEIDEPKTEDIFEESDLGLIIHQCYELILAAADRTGSNEGVDRCFRTRFSRSIKILSLPNETDVPEFTSVVDKPVRM